MLKHDDTREEVHMKINYKIGIFTIYTNNKILTDFKIQ